MTPRLAAAPSASDRAIASAAVLEETDLTLAAPSAADAPDTLLLPMPDVLERGEQEPFRYCLNTSTLRGHGLALPDLIDIAAAAGYEAIEPWVDEIEKYAAGGGDLRDLAERIRDLGLTVEGGIGFFEWAVDDSGRRAKGMDDARHAMSLLARIGGKRVAAPPFGAHESGAPRLDLLAVADRYRDLLEIGDQTGVSPIVEFWGFSANLSRLSEAALIVVDSGHPEASILADVYHLYKGGSPQAGLRLLGPDTLRVFHVNDYPDIPAEAIVDADRVYPGDGVAPLTPVLRDLHEIGFTGVLSLELFNADYYRQDPLTVARTGLEKLRAAVQRSSD